MECAVFRFGVRLFALVFFFLPPVVSWAQTDSGSTAVSPALPTDPLQFLDLAAKANGLQSEAAVPWHVKATFQIYDDQGKVNETGTYEAFWNSPNKFKETYSSPSFSRTIWANDSGTFATSNPKWPGDVEWMIRRSLFDLVPEPGSFKGWDLHWREASIGIKVNCLDAAINRLRLKPQESPVFCFSSGTPVLRYGSEAWQRYQGVFNNIVMVGGAYVAKDVQLMHAKKPYFVLHIDTLEPLPATGDDVFRPDPAAKPVPRRIVIDSDLRDINATYEVGISRFGSAPLTASQTTTQANEVRNTDRMTTLLSGQVKSPEIILQVLVNKKGRVVDARPVRGEMRMQFQAVAAAMKWEFKPYIVGGEPTEFYTELEFW